MGAILSDECLNDGTIAAGRQPASSAATLGPATRGVDTLVQRANSLVGRAVSLGQRFHPAAFTARRQRGRAERWLSDFSLATTARFSGRVLVDATWDNPNYWIRYALLRNALGLGAGDEVGVLGPYRAHDCRATLRRFGVRAIVQSLDRRGPEQPRRRQAAAWLSKVKTPDDVLAWEWPHGVPASFLYDGILKRQRAPTVQLDDSRLVEYVAEALGCVRAAEALLEEQPFDLVVLSHVINFQGAAFAWLAASRRIPVIILYGDYGVARFVKVTRPEDIFDTINRPRLAEFEALPASRARALEAVGAAYLERRVAGQTLDLGGILAFQNSQVSVTRSAVCERFGWDPARPIIGVYISSWFDFPHVLGMTNFRDFYEWFRATFDVAARQPQVNWLFKAHPSEARYGGMALSQVFPAAPRHAQLAPMAWNGAALLQVVDAVVTYHGTSGLEYAARGKPVLLADRGWYHDIGFAKWCRTREEYLEALTRAWWDELDPSLVSRRARILAGWYFGRPAWQGGFVLDDDSVQDPVYAKIPSLFAEHRGTIAREVETIRAWFQSDSRHYHTYKMGLADAFVS